MEKKRRLDQYKFSKIVTHPLNLPLYRVFRKKCFFFPRLFSSPCLHRAAISSSENSLPIANDCVQSNCVEIFDDLLH